MLFLLAEILNFQGSTHQYGVGSFSKIPFFLREKYRGAHQFYVIHTNRNRYSQARHTLDHMDSVFRRRLIVSNY